MEIQNKTFETVNAVTAQALGGELKVVDTQSLVSLGDFVLSSSEHTENWLNTLVMRIGKTIFSYRRYTGKFADLVIDDFEYGAILQKIKVMMPEAEEDESYNLQNGKSVDHYKINKVDAKQSLFFKETPYQFHITIQRVHLKEAFTSEQMMAGFISNVYGETQNAIELALENLGRACLNNYIAEATNAPGTKVIKLLDVYNSIHKDKNMQLTEEGAMSEPAFYRFATGYIKEISKRMTDLTTIYSDGTIPRHTPKELQKLFVMTDFITQSETLSEYAAFNKDLVSLSGYKEISFLQSAATPNVVKVKRASDGVETEVKNVIAVLFDKEALGIYKRDEWSATSPFNAAGGYVNTYWHMKELYFNDLSENFVLFTL